MYSFNALFSADSGVEPCNPDIGQLTTSNHRHRHSTAPGHPNAI
jgi:hypothetical protein